LPVDEIDRGQTREIGIRMALGAPPATVIRAVSGRGLQLIGAGVACGLVLSYLASRFVASLLFGISPNDPVVLLTAPLILVAAGLLACLIPAARAAMVNPVLALRQE